MLISDIELYPTTELFLFWINLHKIHIRRT